MSAATRRESRLSGDYSLFDYGNMLDDDARTKSYLDALAAAVGPDSVVLELGAAAGAYGLAACRLGARHVYGIETDPVVELARRLADDNGMSDRVTYIRALGSDVELPERADVLVFDLRGTLPFYNHSIAAVADARSRLLKPGGVMIPEQDVLMLGVVHAPKIYDALVRPWTTAIGDLDLHRARQMALNGWRGINGPEATLLAAPCSWGTIDYRTVSVGPFTGSASCTVTADGTAHGFLAWFDAQMPDGGGHSNAPDVRGSAYGCGFFPWLEPQELRVGDQVDVTLRILDGQEDYVWTWESRIRSANGAPRAEFRQSTFLGTSYSTEALASRSHSHVLDLSPEGHLVHDVLALVDGRRPLGDIAQLIHSRYPARFADWTAALACVADVAATYGIPDDTAR